MVIMYYKLKLFKSSIVIGIEGNSYSNQIEILPRLTILYGNMKLIAFEWLFWSLSFEFYR